MRRGSHSLLFGPLGDNFAQPTLRYMTTVRFATALVLFALLGCASKPSLKEVNRAQIEQIQQVEIFYNPETHAVVHDFGDVSRQNVVNVAGLFGPFDLIAGAAMAYAASKSALEETAPRTEAFNRAVAAEVAQADMNAEAANALAQRLRASGKTVKVTQVPRLPGAMPGQAPKDANVAASVANSTGAPAAAATAMPATKFTEGASPAFHGYTRTEGYTPLLLRFTTGYAAADVAAAFRSMAIVEYALVDPQHGTYLAEGKLNWVDRPSGPTFATWPGLLAEASGARAQVRKSLLDASGEVVTQTFAFNTR